MFFEEWVIGPQFLGALMMLSAFIQMRFPPKKINDFYGYRSHRSKTDQQTWDEGNRYSTNLLMRYSALMIIIGVLASAALPQFHISAKTFVFIMLGLMISSAIGAIVVMIRYTERHLKQMFPYTK